MKHTPFRSPIDEMFADKPDTRPKMDWPVTDHAGRLVSTHDSYWSAFDAVKADPSLYIGEPRYAVPYTPISFDTEGLTEVHGDPFRRVA